MTQTVTRTVAIIILASLTACATINGIGTDIGKAGDAIANASR